MKLNGSGARRPDWPLLLEVWVERHRATPFAWGAHDCATFALGWVELARPDCRPRAHFGERLEYGSAAAAARVLAVAPLAALVDGWGELGRVTPAYAQRGDLVLVSVAGRESLALAVGDVAAGPGEAGLEFVPMSAAQRAWRV